MQWKYFPFSHFTLLSRIWIIPDNFVCANGIYLVKLYSKFMLKLSLKMSKTKFTKEDIQVCTKCGNYYKFCTVEECSGSWPNIACSVNEYVLVIWYSGVQQIASTTNDAFGPNCLTSDKLSSEDTAKIVENLTVSKWSVSGSVKYFETIVLEKYIIGHFYERTFIFIVCLLSTVWQPKTEPKCCNKEGK